MGKGAEFNIINSFHVQSLLHPLMVEIGTRDGGRFVGGGMRIEDPHIIE